MMSRSESEEILVKGGYVPGTYMIRESDTQPGHFALTVLAQSSAVKHYRILHNTRKIYIHASHMFGSLEDLVAHYIKNPQGRGIHLIRPFKSDNDRKTTGSSKSELSLGFLDMGSEWVIPWETIFLKRCLGDGHFSQVWEACWKGSTLVAVKMPKPGKTNVLHFLREATVMKKLHHPKILEFYGISLSSCNSSEQLPVLITEFISRGNLLEYLRSDEGQKLSLPHLQEMSSQVCSGMLYMEEHNYVHRDLAARNILIDYDLSVKLGDFGLVLLNDGTDSPDDENAPFATKWLAPEVLLRGVFTTKSDVWAFGILLMELVTYGDSPYQGLSNREVATKVENGYQMLQPIDCPDKVYHIACSCWELKPDKRPTFAELNGILGSQSTSKACW